MRPLESVFRIRCFASSCVMQRTISHSHHVSPLALGVTLTLSRLQPQLSGIISWRKRQVNPITEFHAETRWRGEIQIQEAKGFLFSRYAFPRLRMPPPFPLNFGVQLRFSSSLLLCAGRFRSFCATKFQISEYSLTGCSGKFTKHVAPARMARLWKPSAQFGQCTS
jgi:hypothetical protein